MKIISLKIQKRKDKKLGTTSDTNVIDAIQAIWSIKMNDEIEFRNVADSLKVNYRS